MLTSPLLLTLAPWLINSSASSLLLWKADIWRGVHPSYNIWLRLITISLNIKIHSPLPHFYNSPPVFSHPRTSHPEDVWSCQTYSSCLHRDWIAFFRLPPHPLPPSVSQLSLWPFTDSSGGSRPREVKGKWSTRIHLRACPSEAISYPVPSHVAIMSSTSLRQLGRPRPRHSLTPGRVLRLTRLKVPTKTLLFGCERREDIAMSSAMAAMARSRWDQSISHIMR